VVLGWVQGLVLGCGGVCGDRISVGAWVLMVVGQSGCWGGIGREVGVGNRL